jgi:hypothetical protein
VRSRTIYQSCRAQHSAGRELRGLSGNWLKVGIAADLRGRFVGRLIGSREPVRRIGD